MPISMRIRRKRRLLVCVFIFGLIGFGLHWWLTQYYFPVRDVAPIVKLLERKDFGGAANLIISPLILSNGDMVRLPDGRPKRDPNRIQIRGRGADKIKHTILMILNSSEGTKGTGKQCSRQQTR